MDDAGLDVQQMAGVLLRQWRIVAAALIVGLGLGGLTLLLLKPVYSATTLMLVDPSHTDLIDPQATPPGSIPDNALVDGEVELIKSQSTIRAAARALNFVEDSEFSVGTGWRDRLLELLHLARPQHLSPEEALNAVAERMAASVTVQRRGQTFLILVEGRAHDATTAAKIANAVTDAYIRTQLDFKIDGVLEARDTIKARLPELSAAVARSEDEFDRFIGDNIGEIASRTGRTDLLELHGQLLGIEAEQSRAVNLAQVAEARLADSDYRALAEALQSKSLSQLAQDRQGLQASIELASTGATEQGPLAAQLDNLSAALETAAKAEMSSLAARVSLAQQHSDNLRSQLRSAVLEAGLPADMLTSLYALQLNSDTVRRQYESLLARLQALESEVYLQVPDSRVVAHATAPIRPSSPNPPLIITLAGVISLAIGSTIALLVENHVGGFTTEAQLASATGTHVIAAIPRQKDARNAPQLSMSVVTAPLSAFTEALRRIRLGVDYACRQAQPAGGGMVVLVSSALPAEGKTTIALSLARGYALAGRSTLLIDCDLRRPAIHRHLELEPASGLIDVLAAVEGSARPKNEITTRDDATSLQIIPGVSRDTIATDQLISGNGFALLLEQARKTFDVVVLDTPPIEPVADGLYLAPLADVILFVVNRATTAQRKVERSIKAIGQAKRQEVEIVTVLNRQGTARAGHRASYGADYAQA